MSIIEYIIIFVGTVLSIVVSLSLGVSIIKIFRFQYEGREKVIYGFWIGYVGFIFLLLLLNIVMPINIIAMSIIIIISIISMVYHKSYMSNMLKDIISLKHILLFLVLFILGLLWVVSKYNRLTYDTYLYHIGLVNLTNYFPAIKGIVNVHSRLVNIYADFYHMAALNSVGFPSYFMPTLFYIPVLTGFLGLLFTLIINIYNKNFFSFMSSHNFYKQLYPFVIVVVLFIFLTVDSSFKEINRASSEMMSYIVGTMFFIYFMKFLYDTSKENLFMNMILAVLSLWVKLNNLIIIMIFALIITIVWFYKTKDFKTYMLYMGCMIILFIPYFAHSIIKGGVLLFPADSTDFHLPWSNPDAVRGNRLDVIAWARKPGVGYRESLGNFDWIYDWMRDGGNKPRIMFYFKTYIILFVSYVMSLFIKKDGFIKKDIKHNKKSMQYIGFGILGFISAAMYWFLVTPDFIFGIMLFSIPIWMFSAVLLLKVIKLFLCIIKYVFNGIESLSIKEKNMRRLILMGIVVVMFLQFSVSDILRRKEFEERFVVNYVHDSTTVFKPLSGDQCGFRDKEQLPCAPGFMNKDYSFKNQNKWWKGIYKRAYLEQNN